MIRATMPIPRWLRNTFGVPIYPLLAAAYPVVFLYAQNVHEAVEAREVLVPLAVSLGATSAVVAVFWAMTRDWARSALIATVLLALFYTYGMAWQSIGGMLAAHLVLVVPWTLLGIIATAVIWRLPGVARRVILVLNVAASLLVLFNLLVIGAFFLNLRLVADAPSSELLPVSSSGEVTRRPDIYWVILEEYGSQSVLQDGFDYDNAPFLDALRERGFYVADHATANYLKTAPSVAATRNMDYLDGPALREQATAGDDWGPLYRELKAPFPVERYLAALDYRFIYMGTFWAPTARHPDAEINYVYDKLASEFIDVLQRATLLRALEGIGPEAPYDWRRNRYNQTRYQLGALHRASSLGGPKFVVAHFALDHSPYVFHPDGRFVAEDEEKAGTYEANYIGQLRYTNAQMLTWIDSVLAIPAAERPIIILQADEGPWTYGYRRDEFGFDWLGASRAELRQKFGILNAMYLPGTTPELAGLYDSITPVNTFRAVFHAYFGFNLPLLPDRNLVWPDQRDVYNLVDVTDRLADSAK
jgi:hypothetical protein